MQQLVKGITGHMKNCFSHFSLYVIEVGILPPRQEKTNNPAIEKGMKQMNLYRSYQFVESFCITKSLQWPTTSCPIWHSMRQEHAPCIWRVRCKRKYEIAIQVILCTKRGQYLNREICPYIWLAFKVEFLQIFHKYKTNFKHKITIHKRYLCFNF